MKNKRILTALIACISIFALCACNSTDNVTSVSSTTSTRPTSTSSITGITGPTSSNSSVPTSGTKPSTNVSTPSSSVTVPTSTTKPTTIPTTKPAEPAALALPYEIPNYGLVIEKVDPYKGMYVEDGSNDDIDGVAMMLLRNMSSEDVELAQITLIYGTSHLHFEVKALPAGMSVVVQEQNRKTVPAAKLNQCQASVITFSEEMKIHSDEISISENSDNSLTIRNRTVKDFTSVRLFYKYFMENEQLLVGGITFTSNIQNLGAGQEVTIHPYHYLSGASVVVMVSLYEVVT